MANEEHENCSRCGGEKDAEGWCALYCSDDDVVQCRKCGDEKTVTCITCLGSGSFCDETCINCDGKGKVRCDAPVHKAPPPFNPPRIVLG